MKIVSILLIALLILGSYSTFNYAYAVDNNCMIIPIHIIQMPIPLGCIEQRLDALENTTPSGVDTTICGNQGTGTLIHISGTNCDAKALKGSADISITNSSNTITIDYNGTLATESTTCTSAGGTSWIQSSSGGNCVFKGQTVTAPIVLTSNANDLNTSCPTCITTAPLWEKLCQNTLGSASATLSCSSFTARKNLYFAIEYKTISTGTGNTPALQFNADTGTNYSWRTSLNGGADSLGTSQSNIDLITSSVGTSDRGLISCYVYNNLASERKGTSCTGNIGGLGTAVTSAPFRSESAGKWGNTVNQITTITLMIKTGTTNFDIGSLITVWGYD